MCKHTHNFQKTSIENVEVCKWCGIELHIERPKKYNLNQKDFTILTDKVWEKFKKEFSTTLLYVNRNIKEN